MSVNVYVPRDSAALSVGAEGVARAIATEASSRNLEITLIRNGSRGLFWLEPLVEVEAARGRIAYGPVSREAVAGLFDAGFLEGNAHVLNLGPTEDIPYLKQQERLTFARCGIVDPLSLSDYIAHGGYRGLQNALKMEPQAIVDAVQASGLRGRGGAGFPTGIKWNTVLLADADQKYICCNADEGDSGTYADRMIMEGDPFVLIEGMTIAAVAVKATHGYIYCRSEYPHAFRAMQQAIAIAYENGYLGVNVAGSGKRFDLEVRLGAGAYICGEETSMLESLEGKRGQIRPKPPLPAIEGLFGKPTVVNNL
ncbi:MAG: NADH-quinone oxidoreductase subunit L, partial [Bryobacterales bacterium]|nr:NADH-quinone oxidoreductase subunit L [Bryobacterales bacterium]